jgi:hypothetical protein
MLFQALFAVLPYNRVLLSFKDNLLHLIINKFTKF